MERKDYLIPYLSLDLEVIEVYLEKGYAASTDGEKYEHWNGYWGS